MDPWIALGIFLLGAGTGSLVSALLHVEQMRKLKDLLEGRPTTIPKEKNKVTNPTGASPPRPRSLQ